MDDLSGKAVFTADETPNGDPGTSLYPESEGVTPLGPAPTVPLVKEPTKPLNPKTGQTQEIPIADIVVSTKRRALDEEAVQRLMGSLTKLGLRTPVDVYRDENTGHTILVVGGHRLEAARRLGWKTVPANVVEWTPDQLRLWVISENLHRAELTPLERDELLAEWIRLSDQQKDNPAQEPAESDEEIQSDPTEKPTQTVSVSKGGRGKRGGVRLASEKLGVNREDARRAIKVASLPPEAKEFAAKHGLDKSRGVLQNAAKEKNPIAFLQQEVDRRGAYSAATKRDTELVAEEYAIWLREKADPEEIPKLITWIEAAKPKMVVAALRGTP
jgi:ParB family chromosome partitioning protein